MAQVKKFHLTHHVKLRMEQRGVPLEHVKNVVKYPDRVKPLGRGTKGGFLQKFSKTVGSDTIVVVAEIKAGECWLITAYYAT
jgi:hypothetical protein